MSKTKTQIVDAMFERHCGDRGKVPPVAQVLELLELARRLDRDRAALLGACRKIKTFVEEDLDAIITTEYKHAIYAVKEAIAKAEEPLT